MGGLCHRERGGLEMKKMRSRGKLLKMGVIREPQKQGSPGQPSLGTVDSWESLEAENRFPSPERSTVSPTRLATKI